MSLRVTAIGWRTGLLLVAVCWAGLAGAYSQEAPSQRAADLWAQMRCADINSGAFSQANEALVQLIALLPAEQKVPVAAAMMRRGAGDEINAAALELFGTDALPAAELQALVDDENRTWPQRVLVRTYFRFLRPEHETRLSETARRELVTMLAERLTALAGRETISYGEQRLLTHMLQAALTRYAGKEDTVPEMASLRKAMEAYVAQPRDDDVLAASISGWLALPPVVAMTTPDEAIRALGHWDPLVRQKASVYLGSTIRKTPVVAEAVFEALDDPRDEVRAAAAGVFGFALSYKPERVIPAMVKLLIWDRSVIVQAAAAGTLIAHSDEAQTIADRLLEELMTRRPHPGPLRTNSILTTLSYLITDQTPGPLKKRLLEVAVANLEFAPGGALRALEALGADARPAVPNIQAYRDTKADRFTRLHIDRHVLMAIDPDAVPKQ